MRNFGRFIKAVFDDWVSLLSGIASVVLGILGAISRGQIPSWTFWVAAVVCLLFATYRVWRKENMALEKAAEQLKPRVEILEQTETEARHYRIRVRSLSEVGCRFGVNLVELNPAVLSVPLPLPLQHTNEPGQSMVFIPGKQTRLVDVFRMFGPGELSESVISFLGVHHQPIIPKESFELTLSAHCEEGKPVSQVFVIAPRNRTADFRIAKHEAPERASSPCRATSWRWFFRS